MHFTKRVEINCVLQRRLEPVPIFDEGSQFRVELDGKTCKLHELTATKLPQSQK